MKKFAKADENARVVFLTGSRYSCDGSSSHQRFDTKDKVLS